MREWRKPTIDEPESGWKLRAICRQNWIALNPHFSSRKQKSGDQA